MQERVFTLNTAVGVIKTRDADTLLTRMFRTLRSDHMDLATHLNRVVESIDRVASVMLAASLEFALIYAIAWHVRTGC